MAIGPGKLDKYCTYVREGTGAATVIVATIGGEDGGGFSVQSALDVSMFLPRMLRSIADKIEREGRVTKP